MQQESTLEVIQEGAEGEKPNTGQQIPDFSGIIVPKASFDANIAFDQKNQAYIKVDHRWDSSQDGQKSDANQEILNGGNNNQQEQNQINQGLTQISETNLELISEDSEVKKTVQNQRFADNFSILRFIKGQKSKAIEISSSGLSLKVHKTQSTKATDDHLVTTNMGFYTGIHLWEIIAPISCNNIQVGVYNPSTNTQVLTNFKTTTPRTITICLDLNENVLKFWLNDRRNANKNLKLPTNSLGPWIPCVKISAERNKVILNPFAREPSDFYEKDFDKKFSLKKYLVPHLVNMVCVAELPIFDKQKSVAQQLKEHFTLQSSQISTILLPKYEEQDSQRSTSFCFIQFHQHEYMDTFLQNAEKNKWKIYQSHEIYEWFNQQEVQDDIKEPLRILQKHITIPKAAIQNVVTSLSTFYEEVINNQKLSKNDLLFNTTTIFYPFTDKLICAKDQKYVKLVTRNPSTQQFEFQEVNFNENLQHLNSNVNLRIKKSHLRNLMENVNWSQLLKDNNELVNGFITKFFECIKSSATLLPDEIIQLVAPLNVTKCFIDYAIQHMRSQIDRLKRVYQNYSTIVPVNTLINRNKQEMSMDELKSLPFFKDPNFSVDELYTILHVLTDLQEQIWAQTRSSQCSPLIKQFLTQVARPQSTFNRLGSFVSWPISDVQQQELAINGFLYKENVTVSHFENLQVEIQDLSQNTLLNQNNLTEYLGEGNRHLNALITENVPLNKTLNYLPPLQSSNILDIIPSSNNDFVLIGNSNGSVQVCNSSLQLSVLKTVHMLSNDMATKQKTNNNIISKLTSRLNLFDDYETQVLRKSVPLGFLKSIKSNNKDAKTLTSTIQTKASKIKKSEVKKPVQTKKKQKNKKLPPKAQIEEVDEAEFLQDLFGNVEGEQKQKVITQQVSNQKPSQCKILGYFLLSKPAITQVLDPITVGCLFYSDDTKKYYIRVRKLMYSHSYLHHFITLDSVSGQKVNKLTGKQLVKVEDYKELYNEVLNMKENVVDLYSIFMRTQVLKKDWTNKDYKFQVLQDLSESEIEIEDCQQVIDFTRQSYSIYQGQIQVLYQNTKNKTILQQYYIQDQPFDEESHIINVKITKGKELECEENPIKVFQFDDKIITLNNDSYQILRQEDFKVEVNEKIGTQIGVSTNISIINKTLPAEIFNKENLHLFKNSEQVPKQNWTLVICGEDTQVKEIVLTQASSSPLRKMKTERIEDDLNLKECVPSDIEKIGNLLASQYEGSIVLQQPDTILSSSGLNQNNGLYTTHSWQLLNPKQAHQFELKLPENKECHVKQLEVQFSFIKKDTRKIEFKINNDDQIQLPSEVDQNQVRRIPLVVDYLVGAQINDLIQPNYLSNPDSLVFSSNYPQPEFILKHLQNQSFIPQQFIIRSKFNREWNGIPISQGLIFVADDMDSLMNTKQFAKFTEKEYKKWKEQRDKLKDIPLLPNEPIAFFDLEDKAEVVVHVQLNRPYKYVKFIPLAFRSKPINFSSKAFHSNQAECQFFGVNGILIDEEHKSFNTSQNQLDMIDSRELNLNINASIKEQNIGEVGKIESLKITEIRNPKANNAITPILSLKELSIPNVIGIAKAELYIKEEHSDQIQNLILQVQNFENELWELHGVTLSLRTYSDQSANFNSETLSNNKPRLRHYLLDYTMFDKLIKQLLNIIQDQQQSDDMRVSSMKCLLQYIKGNKKDKNFSKMLQLIKENTDINQIINETFIDQSLEYQKIAEQLLLELGINKSDKFIENLVQTQIDKLLTNARSIENVKQVFDMIQFCNKDLQTKIQSSFVEILMDKICKEELPKYQTQEYITLRSKYNLNRFPFDDIEFGTSNSNGSQHGSTDKPSLLDCDIYIQKISTLYQYTVDLRKQSALSNLKLYFDEDSRSLYKACIRIIVPDQQDNEKILYQRVIDENLYTQFCEKADKKEIQQYFMENPIKTDQNQEGAKVDKFKLGLNCFSIDLFDSQTRYLKVQIDLLDTYRSVHKNSNATSILIRPEFYGHITSQDKDQTPQPSNYKIPLIIKTLLLSTLNFGNIKYDIYSSSDQLGTMHKACVMSLNQGLQSQETNKEEVDDKQISTEDLTKTLNEQRENLKELINPDQRKKITKKQLKEKLSEINKLTKKSKQDLSAGKLSLRYLLNVSELAAQQILQAYQQNNGLFESYNQQELYMTLFKHFTVYDQGDLYPNIQKLLQILFDKIQDKAKFVADLYRDFLMQPNTNYNQSNILNFIKTLKNIRVNDLFKHLNDILGSSDQQQDKITNQDDVTKIFEQLRNPSEIEEELPIHSVIAFLTMLDNFSSTMENEQKPDLNIELLLKLFYQLIQKSPQIRESTNQQGNVALQYLFNVLKSFLKLKEGQIENPILNQQKTMLTIIILSLLKNEKELDKSRKELIQELLKYDSQGILAQLFNVLLQWYKNKDNISNCYHYQIMDLKSPGLGQGMFFKHLSMVFKQYVTCLQKQPQTSADTIENAYKDLSLLMNDLLKVLVLDQDQPNYEKNFSFVWVQLYKSLGFLIQHNIHNQDIINLYARQFYNLQPLYQELIYPLLHNASEKMIGKDRQSMVLLPLLKGFLEEGFKHQNSIKIAYCICDGLLNIIQTGSKDKQNQTIILSKFTKTMVHDLTVILSEFLQTHTNHGVFTGVTGAQLVTIMQLDIAIQMASILDNAANEQGNSFTEFIKDAIYDEKQMNEVKSLVKQLIQWICMNFTNQKGKSSPAGIKILTLSTLVENLLNKVQAQEYVVSQCLPILMKSVLSIDYKLRDLLKAQLINQERSISIQRTVNTLFLSFFKQWVQTDNVAKQFLIELNGFDFLLDRLFSKVHHDKSDESEQQKDKEEQPQIKQQNEVETDLFGNEIVPEDNNEDEGNEDELINLVMKKLNIKKQPTKTEKKPNESVKSKIKGDKIKIPLMKKQTGEYFDTIPSLAMSNTVSEVKGSNESNEAALKDVEQKLLVDDYAKSMKLVWTSDKQGGVQTFHSNTQWHKFKNGTKNKLYSYQITDPTFNYEYVMKFELESVIQLTELQVGILYNWSTYDPDCQYEPLSFILEGGVSSKDEMDWKVLMTPLQDDGFKMNSITVYGYNFVENKAHANQDQLESVGLKECKYITMRLRKPLMSCLDQSLYTSCTAKPKSYGISYISVMGNKQSKPSAIYQYLVDLQKENSLEVLSKFFSGAFTEAFEIISEQPQIINKIKNAFDKLSVLLNTKASLIKPIFLAICSKNMELGDWIMMNRLISLNPEYIKKEQIIFLGDIISSNKEMQLVRLNKLKTYILSQMSRIVTDKVVLSNEQQLLMARYLKLFNTKLREYSNFVQQNQKQLSEEDSTLSFKVSDLDNAIMLMSQCSSSKSQKLFNFLISFTLILLLPPKPLQNKTIQVHEYMDTLLSTTGKSDSQITQNILFCSIIATTDQNTLQSILDKQKIEWVMTELKNQIENKVEKEDNHVYQYAQILFNCSKQPKFRDQYRSKLVFELYNLLKKTDTQDSLLRQSDQLSLESISLLVQTIRDTVIGGSEEIEQLSSLLKEDIIKASEIEDVEFINKVIVPILHAEEKVPVTINILDKTNLEKGLQPIYVGSEAAASKDSFFLQTNILNQKQKNVFSQKLKEIAGDKVDNYQKLLESKWELIFEDKAHQNQNPAKFKKFITSVSNKNNVILFVQCKMNEQTVVFGGFTNKHFPALGESWAHEFDYQVPFSEANFVCYYTPDKEQHFTMTHNKPFGYIYTDYEEGGALSISGDFFLVSWSYEFQNSCGNIYDMKCIEDPSVMSFYSNMTVEHIEVFWCNYGTKSQINEGKLKSELKKSPLYKTFSPFSFFRDNLIFEVSKEMTLSQLAQEIFGKNQVFIKYPEIEEKLNNKTKISELQKSDQQDPILELVIVRDAPKEDDQKAQQEKQKDEDVVKESEDTKVQHDQPILKRFEDKGGIFDLIKAAKAAVKQYQNDKLREMWHLWLQEIESFSQLPSFFQQFCQDREKETIIYNLLEGKNDLKKVEGSEEGTTNQTFINQQEELHIEMVKYSYKIVSQVFANHESAELRDQCISNGTFERFIERIGQLSSEKKRTKVSVSVSASEASSPEKGKAIEKSGSVIKKAKKIHQDKTKQRKGVGYTTGVGTTWNVTEYLKSKEAKSVQAANIVNILKNMIRSKDWQAPAIIKDMLLESALLPTLEAAFRSGSLLDMAKDFDLNMAYLGFVQEFVNHPNLIDLVLPLSEEYEPKQKQPIYQLLSSMSELAKIFLQCLPADDQTKLEDDQIKPKQLAEKIEETNKIVQEKINEQSTMKEILSLQEILSMPLSEAYQKLLSGLRFEYMNMKSTSGTYNHAYIGELTKAVNPPVSKLVRLAQEIADLSNSLPCDHTDAIFCRVDKERVDLMKCLIMGASGTPYAHGAFIYDLFFENSYPNVPPKCQLVTTGGQTVRFNPNLYNNGKVCLSLLGTWRGSSTENWDPKLSTILQVLLSIQAIIMSNEVYFNEPGYEHEAGTVDGERKNEGYANIVRYCNIKFAIIDAIKNPPAGFEKVIRRSFYLKKNEILREVKEWVDRSKVTDALYTGLVFDHNYHWAPQISPEGKYAELMDAIYKELEETLESIQSPFEDEATGTKIERKFSKREVIPEDDQLGGTIAKIEDIDVSYEPSSNLNQSENQISQSINIEDEKVKDRWSRYIGAMGIEAVAKQAEARILICGLGSLGIEIAKNIVLAGCKELILCDPSPVKPSDLSGQFFLTEKDLQTPDQGRAALSKDKLQQLNFYVKVTDIGANVVLTEFIQKQNDIKVVVLTESNQMSPEGVIQLNNICREKGIAFIYTTQNGLFSQVFNDFGKEFIVLDKDGEELQEVMIKDISYDEEKQQSVVTLLEGFKHKFEDNDQVIIKEVLGMQSKQDPSKTITDVIQTVKVINPSKFTISEDVRNYTKYEGNGTAKQIKVPKKIEFQTYEETLQEGQEEKFIDQNLFISDFEKIDNIRFLHYIYRAFENFRKYKAYETDLLQNVQTFLNTCVKINLPKDLSEDQMKKLENMVYIFAYTCKFSFPPISAFIGGIVSQEIIKAITQKYSPIHQYFYFDCSELFHIQDIRSRSVEDLIEEQAEGNQHQKRHYGLLQCLGDDLLSEIQNCKVFMIGAGAIGCELLKNYAMLGLGTGEDGMITLTDPDVIEVSNLNRQFLFREKHLRKPKSQTAAAAAIQMNPDLKNHISARLDKIHDGTAHVYNENFFKKQTIVTNALDNVQARLYIDGKCVAARTPLIDSGTLGPKGHVQMIIPYKTESYGSQRDPEDNTEIPHCTLKMFPEETLHCVEWAKDLFGNIFYLQPQSYNKLVIEEANKEVNLYDQQEVAALKKVLKTVEKQPKSFYDCLRLARLRFQKHFVNDIKQLLHVYPLDKVTKDGRPFWSLPKRPPQAVEFDPENLLHASMVSSCACLYGKIYNIELPHKDLRSKESKLQMAKKAAQFEVAEFVPNDQKAQEIESKVEKEQSKVNEEEQTDQQELQQEIKNDVETLKKRYQEFIKPLKKDQSSKKMVVEEFEKDNDNNYHIDFIHSMANIRASNYKMEEMDWINVKIKAGRIVPALATTTAAIAALQTIELIKYLKKCKLEEHRNSFLNLAVPSLMMSEPGVVAKTQLKEGLQVTLWDRWEFETSNKYVSLLEVIEHFETKHGLSCRDVFCGSQPLFIYAIQGKEKLSRLQLLTKPVIELAHLQAKKDSLDFIDLTITFVDESKPNEDDSEKMIEGVPPIRVTFKKQ